MFHFPCMWNLIPYNYNTLGSRTSYLENFELENLGARQIHTPLGIVRSWD